MSTSIRERSIPRTLTRTVPMNGRVFSKYLFPFVIWAIGTSICIVWLSRNANVEQKGIGLNVMPNSRKRPLMKLADVYSGLDEHDTIIQKTHERVRNISKFPQQPPHQAIDKDEFSKSERMAINIIDEKPIIISWDNSVDDDDRQITCGTSVCQITRNRDFIHTRDFLGIIFNGSKFGSDGLPLPRKPGHLWSLLHDQSPRTNDWLFSAKSAMSLFNLTGTFRRESHYPFPTMRLKDEEELLYTSYWVPVALKNRLRKEGLAAIVFVHSDCETASDRSHYMRLLNQFVPIDSYGDCEHNIDFPSRLFIKGSGKSASTTSPDFYRLLARYKFVLAFEDAICNDYVTEGFWRALRLGVVPIVFGSRKIEDLTPNKHSIIDIRNFQSVHDIATYISYLDTNDNEYNKYTEFKYSGITNPVLKDILNKRNWGPGKPRSGYGAGFECFICETLTDIRAKILSGQSFKTMHGSDDHYGCGAPLVFNSLGLVTKSKKGRVRVRIRSRLMENYIYGQYYLDSLKYHMNITNDIDSKTIHQHAQKLQRLARDRGGPFER